MSPSLNELRVLMFSLWLAWKSYMNGYRQMGELWTLFEFACSLYLTCNMVLDMDGSISWVIISISWVLLCFMIFSMLRLYGIKFRINQKEKILLGKVTPGFGVTLDGIGKLWTVILHQWITLNNRFLFALWCVEFTKYRSCSYHQSKRLLICK